MSTDINMLNFGVEFEFSTQFDDIKPIVIQALDNYYGKVSLIAQNRWFKSINNYRKWHLKYDGSTECELVSPISRYTDIDKICDVIKFLGENSVKVTSKDSTHIHIDIGEVDVRKVLLVWLMVEKTLVKCFPKNRQLKYHRLSYCSKLIRDKYYINIAEIFDKAIAISKDHHSVFSTFHYNTRNTVEFRIGEGTTDPQFVKSWIYICLSIVKKASKIDILEAMPKTSIRSFQDVFHFLGIRKKITTQMFTKRYLKYRKSMIVPKR